MARGLAEFPQVPWDMDVDEHACVVEDHVRNVLQAACPWRRGAPKADWLGEHTHALIRGRAAAWGFLRRARPPC